MAALARRCWNSSEACVRLCRRATSSVKRRPSTPRSPRSRRDTGPRTRFRLPLRRPQRRLRLQPESRAPRQRRRPRRPRPLNPPLSSAPLRPQRLDHPSPRRDRPRKRERQANPGPQTRAFRARRSDLRRRHRNGASQPGAPHRRRPRLWGSQPHQRRRPRLLRLDPSWLLRWPASLPSHRRPAGPLRRSGRRAAKTRVCQGWRL